jgi:hypothetical protein
MSFAGMLRRVTLVRIDVSDELSASIIRVTRICEIGTALAITSNRSTLRQTLQRNVGSYKSGTAKHPRRRILNIVTSGSGNSWRSTTTRIGPLMSSWRTAAARTGPQTRQKLTDCYTPLGHSGRIALRGEQREVFDRRPPLLGNRS